MTTAEELEGMARALEESGDYRVLRRLKAHHNIAPPANTVTRLGLLVDVETTGLDSSSDEIIELAMTPFRYGFDGTIYVVEDSFQKLRAPARPIPPEITSITGIDDAMVAGHSFSSAEVEAFASSADIVVAHNAEFDRRFLERFCGIFVDKPWACSMTQVDWADEGFEGTKLAYLASSVGFFYESHRAVHDCLATIELLTTMLPKSRMTALATLLANARLKTRRIWAENAPFECKDVLKARGYKWNGDGGSIGPRAWYIDLQETQYLSEIEYLRREVYRRNVTLPSREIDAYNRFSSRV